MGKPTEPAGPPAPAIEIDPPFIRLVPERGADPIEVNAFAIVSVEPDGRNANVTTASGDPNWAHRYVWHDPAAVKRAVRLAIRRTLAASAAAPAPRPAPPVRSVAEQLADYHRED